MFVQKQYCMFQRVHQYFTLQKSLLEVAPLTSVELRPTPTGGCVSSLIKQERLPGRYDKYTQMLHGNGKSNIMYSTVTGPFVVFFMLSNQWSVVKCRGNLMVKAITKLELEVPSPKSPSRKLVLHLMAWSLKKILPTSKPILVLYRTCWLLGRHPTSTNPRIVMNQQGYGVETYIVCPVSLHQATVRSHDRAPPSMSTSASAMWQTNPRTSQRYPKMVTFKQTW